MNIPAEQIVGNGKNIKCHDKIKLTHVATNNRIHANNFECKGGSFNTAVTCHKARDDSDWYHFLQILQVCRHHNRTALTDLPLSLQ